MKTDYVNKRELEHLLAALMPANRLVLEISLATGLRIGDVLNMRSDALQGAKDRRMTVRELKTGKTRRITLPAELYRRAVAQAGKAYVFEHRHDWRKHRTRQAVYKDIVRIAKAFRMHGVIAPHTARKVYAVEEYQKSGGDLKRVQTLLNHSSEAVTMLYALADELTIRNGKTRRNSRRSEPK